MPIYEYEVQNPIRSCPHCRSGFDVLQGLNEDALRACPECGHPVVKRISSHTVGGSKSGYDQRAKEAGFHKLKRADKGVYEKEY